ncbi:hypothetical protein J5N97_025526 [Dioscorea zingiberensis]|uniref:Uncharacterized protein n=1 Tax=Dioscorea zingiberensis TaxID=325984 RepID=A0A9D5C9C0_9LILI|nr:hypothetical protein J5N97_025526 [Dioscorea zingiberensis]
MACSDGEGSEEWIERVKTEGAVPLSDPENCPNGWATPPGDKFMVRGPDYMSTKVKIPGGEYLLKPLGFDWIKGSMKIGEVLSHPNHRVRRAIDAEVAIGNRPFVWAFNLQLPCKDNYSAIAYFLSLEPIEEGSLMDQFLKGDDSFRNSRLKLIANIVKGPWIVRTAVGEQAICILGRALSCKYVVGANFIEVDVDIGSSMVANAIVHLAFGYITTLTVDLAFLIESQTELELPERILGAVIKLVLPPQNLLVAILMAKMEVNTSNTTRNESLLLVLLEITLPMNHMLLSYADTLDWVLMALGTLGSVVHGMAQPVGYLLLGKALDAFGKNAGDEKAMVPALEKVVPYVWYMAIATLPAGMLEISSWMYTSERQLARLRLAFLRAVLSQDIEAFDTELTMGKIITGVTSHMSIIQDAIGEKLGHFISSFSTFVVGIIIAFICCWQVALLTLIVVPLILLVGGTYTAQMNNISATRMKYLSEATTMVEQTLSQIKTVFSFVGEISAMKSFAMFMEKHNAMSKKEAIIKGTGMGMFQAVTFCSWALIVWVGAVAVSANKSEGGETLAAVMCILFGAISITYAAPDLQIFQQAKSAGTEVFQIIDRKPGISHDTEGQKLEKVIGDIDIRDVYFAYPSRKDKLVLQGLSLSIPAGRVVALVGSSGCGKSTVISLLERFYDPLSGGVFIDGHNIKDLDLRFLRRNIAAVSQEPSLFTGTIKDNLKVGKLDASDDQIAQAASTANIHLFISQLPDQYLTEVGERGLKLSGGQRQRIAIARAILKDPPILLLDEATSALDSESEKLVQDALEKAMQGRTVVLIAHRMSTVINSDMIVVFENGKVAQSGTHHELLESSKFYSNLFEAQNPINFEESNSRGMNFINQGTDSSKKTSAQNIESNEQFKESEALLRDSPGQEIQERTDITFFRIWFNLKKFDFAKIAVGSCSAALSGISKPLFGFFIITIGMAYYGHDPVRKDYLSNILAAVLRNEIAWFEKPENAAGRVTSHIISDTSMIKTIISDRMSMIIQCISSILIATTVSIIVNWRMALVAWAVMPCHFIGGLVQAKSAKGFSANATVSHRELVGLASESTSNIRTIASFVYEEQILTQAKLALRKPMRISRIESVKYGIIQGVSLCLWNIAHAVALWYTIVLIKNKQATFEDGIRSYQIFSLTVPSITELWTLIPMVMSAINILKPAFQILDRETQIVPDIPDIQDNEQIEGSIEFEHVSFNYPTRPELVVLSNFSLTIEAGQSVAIVGPSGAGKSSIIALILRFYDPCKGRILINMRDIKTYNLRWLRKQIGLVQQEPPLFCSSIRDNICYGNESASETEIVEAAIEANIHHFITNLPQGYDTLVGEKGCQLSGGQKQRVAIARALVKRPAVLLLDEATSALDAETERSVMNALRPRERKQDIQPSKTTQITVAHRLSTVINSDVIIVMDKGKVVEVGNHKSLIAESGGAYSKLFNLHNQTTNTVNL